MPNISIKDFKDGETNESPVKPNKANYVSADAGIEPKSKEFTLPHSVKNSEG